MSTFLHLIITTPQLVLIDCPEVISLRGEDASGCFGLLPGHVDFLTVLIPSVLRWTCHDGEQKFCAVRGGILSLYGPELRVACREGVIGEHLDELEAQVQRTREAQLDMARRSRVEHLQLHTRAVRQLMRYLRQDGEAPRPFEDNSP